MTYFSVCGLKSLLVFIIVSAIAIDSQPIDGASSLPYNTFSTSLISDVQQQYYSQNGLGQYSYSYNEPLSRKQETRGSDGVTRGSYSYRDANGQLQTVDYIADSDGFRVAATNLPQVALNAPPQSVVETAEVAAARAQHLAAYEEVIKRLSLLAHRKEEKNYDITPKSAASPSTAVHDKSPLQAKLLQSHAVGDTAEVAAAKLEFFRRYAEEQQRQQLLRQQRRNLPYFTVRNDAGAQPEFVTASKPIALSYQRFLLPSSIPLFSLPQTVWSLNN